MSYTTNNFTSVSNQSRTEFTSKHIILYTPRDKTRFRLLYLFVVSEHRAHAHTRVALSVASHVVHTTLTRARACFLTAHSV